MEQNLGTPIPGEKVPEATVEALAKDVFGWKPKEEFVEAGGNPDNWTSAEEYIRNEKKIRENLSISLANEKAEKAQTIRTLDSLKNHYVNLRKSVEAEFKDEIKALREAKRKYISDGETERALLMDDQIDVLKEKHEEKITKIDAEASQAVAAPVDQNLVQSLQQELFSWNQANPWYKGNTNDPDTQLADDFAIAYATKNGGAPTTPEGYRQMLKHVEKKMRDVKPNLFINPNAAKPSAVDDGGGKSTSQSKDRIPTFTADQERIYQSFVNADIKGEDGKVISRAQVWREWKQMGAV